jgi:hypothetical protein
MVQCVKSGVLKSRDGMDVCRVTAGTTRCSVSYWAVRQWPEYFLPIDKRDTRTVSAHRGNLKRARQELERGARTAPRPRTSSLFPAPRSAPLRLPRPARPRRVLP